MGLLYYRKINSIICDWLLCKRCAGVPTDRESQTFCEKCLIYVLCNDVEYMNRIFCNGRMFGKTNFPYRESVWKNEFSVKRECLERRIFRKERVFGKRNFPYRESAWKEEFSVKRECWGRRIFRKERVWKEEFSVKREFGKTNFP